jgi:hypothetical protein
MFGMSAFAQSPFAGLGDSAVYVSGSVDETFTLTDIQSTNLQIHSTINELFVLTSTTNYHGWFIIDDSQTPSWVAISNGQGANWVNINNTHSTSWTMVNDSQSINWEEIDDTQTPNWTNINTG